MTWVKVFQKNWLHSIPSAGLQSGASTKTGGNKHNIAIIPPKSLYDTYLQMFSRCPDEKSYSREFHTLKKSFITILSSSDNCYFSKQSLPPEWVPGDIVLEMIIQQAKNYAPSFSSYKLQCRGYSLKFLKLLCLFRIVINKLIWKQTLSVKCHVRNRNAAKGTIRRETSFTSEHTSFWKCVILIHSCISN